MRATKALGVLGVATLAAASVSVVDDVAGADSPEVFDEPGSSEFEVPADVCEITVDAIGAEGGGVSGPGGLGGRAVATVPVTPGETLQVRVGGRGVDPLAQPGGAGGSNGGGVGGIGAGSVFGGAGGGGASDVRDGGFTDPERLVVAGGGGGDGNNSQGGDGGGTTGTTGEQTGSGPFLGAPGGTGGTQVGPGTGGGGAAGDGVGATGGPGGDGSGVNQGGGGGGGGGFFGGGGGGGSTAFGAGGGGGGSGFTPDGTGMTNGVDAENGGDGIVTITYEPDPRCDGPLCLAGPGNGAARIKKSGGSFIGQQVYNCSGTDQQFARNQFPADKAKTFTYFARVKNDGGTKRDITVHAEVASSVSTMKAKFFKGNKNITDKVISDGKTFAGIKSDGSTPEIKIKVKVNATPANEGVDVFFWGQVNDEPVATGDTVKVHVDTNT